MTQPRTLSTPAYVPVRRGRGPLLISGAVFSLGGGAILLVVIAAQLQTSLVYGGVFAVVSIAQVGLAVALLAAPARGRVVGAAAVSLAVIAVWVLARTVGLPGPGPWLPVDTAVGFTDYLCLALEALAALLLVVSAARWPRELARRLAAAGSPVELVLVQGAQHGLNDPSQRPTPAQLSERVASFLTHLLTSQ